MEKNGRQVRFTPGLQLSARSQGLPPDSSRPTWIGAEGGTPGKIWDAALTSYPPQCEPAWGWGSPVDQNESRVPPWGG